MVAKERETNKANTIWDEGENFTDENSNGIWDGTVPGELNGWALNEIFLYNGSFDAYNSFGCNNEDACNQDEAATADDGSCIYSPSGENSGSESWAGLSVKRICSTPSFQKGPI